MATVEFTDPTYTEVQEQISRDIQMLGDVVGTHASQLGEARRASQSVREAVQRMLRDEWSLERGEFISRIFRLPQHWQNMLMECVCNTAPYDRASRFDLEVEMVNAGGRPVIVTLDTVEIPEIDPETGAERDGYEVLKKHYSVAPGERLVVDAQRASALMDKVFTSMKIGFWRTQAGRAAKMPLREIGYTASFVDISGATPGRVTVTGGTMRSKGKGKAA